MTDDDNDIASDKLIDALVGKGSTTECGQVTRDLIAPADQIGDIHGVAVRAMTLGDVLLLMERKNYLVLSVSKPLLAEKLRDCVEVLFVLSRPALVARKALLSDKGREMVDEFACGLTSHDTVGLIDRLNVFISTALETRVDGSLPSSVIKGSSEGNG